jgi:hypothetical protein
MVDGRWAIVDANKGKGGRDRLGAVEAEREVGTASGSGGGKETARAERRRPTLKNSRSRFLTTAVIDRRYSGGSKLKVEGRESRLEGRSFRLR